VRKIKEPLSELTRELAQIHWEGDSRMVLAGFPEQIREDFGFALFEMQQGKVPSIAARRMASIGRGVYELKDADVTTWYRVIYLSKINDVIHVLHCFEKNRRKTDRRDLKIATERLSRVHERIEADKKHAKNRK
jgi:phage-related protein